ncbi:MAG: prepilin-type N-terminal cleavage/methylation domain-containing protein [Candidatus Omnitrophica bacterium]|nr:prepilin-type N-terminal cleavage/methylation domain-containing protein [Candidatus Omnitrophota bacterium]
MRKGYKKGFTLVEVMIAAAVIALGTVLIYGAFFTTLDSFNYYSHYLQISPRLGEKLWEAQDHIRQFGPAAFLQREGEESVGGKQYSWALEFQPVLGNDLFQVDLRATWKEGARMVKLRRTMYARFFFFEEKDK